MMCKPPVLLADGALVKLIFFAVVGLIYLISHLINNANRKRPLPQARQPQRQPAAGGNPNPRDEVGEFLRRAAQRRAATGQAAQSASLPSGQQSPRPRQRPSDYTPVEAEPVTEAELVSPPPTGAAVAQHVRQHLDTSAISARATALAQVPQHVTQAIEAHVHQVFDHQVGRLASQPTVTAEPQAAPAATQPDVQAAAAGLAPLLAAPERLREAIILTEILRSPLDRW